MSLADEVLAEHFAVPVMNGERCGECEARFPCLPVRLATKLKAAEQVVEAARESIVAGDEFVVAALDKDKPRQAEAARRIFRVKERIRRALAEYDKEGQG